MSYSTQKGNPYSGKKDGMQGPGWNDKQIYLDFMQQ